MTICHILIFFTYWPLCLILKKQNSKTAPSINIINTSTTTTAVKVVSKLSTLSSAEMEGIRFKKNARLYACMFIPN